MKDHQPSHADLLLPEWATRHSNGAYMEAGAQLRTRDGRRMGNAYVDRIEGHASTGELAVVITDMGSRSRMTAAELEELFYPPSYVMRVDEARQRRVRTDTPCPDGFAIVPLTPTKAMVTAGGASFEHIRSTHAIAQRVWDAMIAASK